MTAIELPFIGGAYAGPSTNINAQVCQNLFPIPDVVGGKTMLALRNTPGMKLWATVGSGDFRGNFVWYDYLYSVVGNTIYKINSNGVSTSVGTLSTTTGDVYMCGGVTYMLITDGSKGYYRIQADTTLTEITDADFPIPGSCEYQDGYFIVSEKDTDYFYISAVEDPSSWDSLEFASAEDTPDDVLVLVSHARQLWLFGEETTEVFVNTGNSTYPFSRLSGAVLPIGVGAKGSVARGPEGLYLIDNYYRPRHAAGYDLVGIAPEQIQHQIDSYERKDDAEGWIYSMGGHSFYVLTFPTAKKTWVYDITTQLWHSMSSGLTGGIHRGKHGVSFADKILVGDCYNGNLYELDYETYSDVGDNNRRVRTAQPIHKNRSLVSFSSFEIEFESGVGLVTGQGSDPQAMLDWSDDGGHTWSNEHWASIGKIGEYKTRVIWRRLGVSRSRIFRVTISDPVKIFMIGAFLEGG